VWVLLCVVWLGAGSCLGDEVFVARVVSGGKVTIPLLVREMLRIEEGDYVRVSINEVIRKKQQQRERAGRRV